MTRLAAVVAALCLFLAHSVAHAVDVGIEWDPAAGWKVQDCAGAPIVLSATVKAPVCIVLVSAEGRRVWIETDATLSTATLAGISGGLRTVYSKSSTGKLGVKLGTIHVGTVAAPFGITCDANDKFVSGASTYSKVTDARIAASLRGYSAGCR